MTRIKTTLRYLAGILLLASFGQLRAGSYYTGNAGSWGVASTWVNGQMPPLTGTDSIYIQHDVMYSYSIVLVSSTYLVIDTAGSLCGHHRFFVQNGSSIHNYGEFDADTLVINGGYVYNHGLILLRNSAIIVGGGIVNSGSMQIGATFLCPGKNIGDGITEEKNPVYYFRQYPQPAKNGQEIHIENLPRNCSILIFSLTGQLLLEEKNIENGSFFINGFSQGTYLIEAIQQEKLLFHGKLILTE